MTAVECSCKSAPYSRQVSAGTLASDPLTANTSLGLRTTCTIQFTVAQTITSRTVPAMIWADNGATRMARNARRPRRETVERRVRRPRMRVSRNVARAIIAWGMGDTHPLSSITDRQPSLALRAAFGYLGALGRPVTGPGLLLQGGVY